MRDFEFHVSEVEVESLCYDMYSLILARIWSIHGMEKILSGAYQRYFQDGCLIENQKGTLVTIKILPSPPQQKSNMNIILLVLIGLFSWNS